MNWMAMCCWQDPSCINRATEEYRKCLEYISSRLRCVLIPPLYDETDVDWFITVFAPLQWRYNGRDSVSNHQPNDFYSTVNSDANLRKHQGSASLPLCGEFTGDPAQMASNAEKVSIWWRHHGYLAVDVMAAILRRLDCQKYTIYPKSKSRR